MTDQHTFNHAAGEDHCPVPGCLLPAHLKPADVPTEDLYAAIPEDGDIT